MDDEPKDQNNQIDQEQPIVQDNQGESNQNKWQYTSGNLVDQKEPEKPDISKDEVLAEWTAHEFIHHDKSPKWYFLLAGAVVIVSVLLFVITREIMSIIISLVLGVVFGMYANAQPKIISYKLTPHGILTDNKQFLFTDFKSYSVMQDVAMPYIQLIPRQRFMVALSIYVEPTELEKIANLLGDYIPYDQKERDFVDKLVAKIRY